MAAMIGAFARLGLEHCHISPSIDVIGRGLRAGDPFFKVNS
jgi:hypothetical protein